MVRGTKVQLAFATGNCQGSTVLLRDKGVGHIGGFVSIWLLAS